MKTYKEFIIKAEPNVTEIISGILWTLNITGLVEENETIKVYCNSGEVLKQDLEKKLTDMANEGLIQSFKVQENEFEEMNWNEEWEKSLNVIEVSDKIVIKPSFREYMDKPGQIVLTIDPKMSFGTGEHQTTKLMLLMIEKYIEPGKKVFDIGTGTGVLAIASVKLGAGSALAIDNDEWCFENGIENCRINSVTDKVEIRTASIDQVPENNFDIILANINKNILLELSEKIKDKIEQNGILILSGLLIEDETEIAGVYGNAGFQMIDKQKMEEWITLVFKSS